MHNQMEFWKPALPTTCARRRSKWKWQRKAQQQCGSVIALLALYVLPREQEKECPFYAAKEEAMHMKR